MSRTIFHAFWLPVAIMACSVNSASAQSNSLFGTSGPLSQGIGGASRAGAASPLGAGGMGGLGAGGLGAAGGQAGGLNGPQFSGLSNLGQLSATVGQNGFIGGNSAANGGRFIGGARTTGQQGAQQGQQGLNRNQAGQQNRGANQANRNGANQNGFNIDDLMNGQRNSPGQKKTTTAAPPQQKVAFQFSDLRAEEITQKIQTRLQKQTSLSVKGADRLASSQVPVNVTLDESGVATLRGQVTTDDSKRLIEALVRLEPGVRKVTNELEVAN